MHSPQPVFISLQLCSEVHALYEHSIHKIYFVAEKRRARLLDVFSKILVIDERLLIDHLKSRDNFGELAVENITGFHDDVEKSQLCSHENGCNSCFGARWFNTD